MTHLPLLTYEARPSGHEIVTFGVNITLYNFTGDWANSKRFGTDWVAFCIGSSRLFLDDVSRLERLREGRIL